MSYNFIDLVLQAVMLPGCKRVGNTMCSASRRKQNYNHTAPSSVSSFYPSAHTQSEWSVCAGENTERTFVVCHSSLGMTFLLPILTGLRYIVKHSNLNDPSGPLCEDSALLLYFLHRRQKILYISAVFPMWASCTFGYGL